ncbi:MAG: hypothetical protein WB710_19005 [Stellaceae bacterium]
MNEKSSSTGWRVAGAAVGVLVLLGIASNLKDVFRYIKISNM